MPHKSKDEDEKYSNEDMIEAIDESISNESSGILKDEMYFNGINYDTDVSLETFMWDPGEVLNV